MRLLQSFVVFCVLIFPNLGNAENSGNKWNFYTGMFDYSDKGKRSNLFGIQHINEDLYRETSFGVLQPVTGAFITSDNAAYLYSGFQIPKKNGSFSKDLSNPFLFKSIFFSKYFSTISSLNSLFFEYLTSFFLS